jgi:uncharacterized protein YdeI (YjbR/CyaY-like superfamily)
MRMKITNKIVKQWLDKNNSKIWYSQFQCGCIAVDETLNQGFNWVHPMIKNPDCKAEHH